jgi:hypothetical protein
VSDIRVGDLVIITRDCCGSFIGRVAVVEDTHPADAWASAWMCRACGSSLPSAMPIARLPALSSAPEDKRRGWWPLPWIKRIPPLDELERDQFVKELSV